MKAFVTRGLAPLSLLAFAQSPALAASLEQWEAVSRTAMAVTGTVQFSADRITFQNGKFLPLAPAGTITVSEGRESRPATLYRVTKPDDPVLLQGNRLCGGRTPDPVIFIVVWRHRPFGGDVDPRDLIVYSGNASRRMVAGTPARPIATWRAGPKPRWPEASLIALKPSRANPLCRSQFMTGRRTWGWRSNRGRMRRRSIPASQNRLPAGIDGRSPHAPITSATR